MASSVREGDEDGFVVPFDLYAAIVETVEDGKTTATCAALSVRDVF
jgi:hypothetical protein